VSLRPGRAAPASRVRRVGGDTGHQGGSEKAPRSLPAGPVGRRRGCRGHALEVDSSPQRQGAAGLVANAGLFTLTGLSPAGHAGRRRATRGARAGIRHGGGREFAMEVGGNSPQGGR
jgi:hypothetical protein